MTENNKIYCTYVRYRTCTYGNICFFRQFSTAEHENYSIEKIRVEEKLRVVLFVQYHTGTTNVPYGTGTSTSDLFLFF